MVLTIHVPLLIVGDFRAVLELLRLKDSLETLWMSEVGDYLPWIRATQCNKLTSIDQSGYSSHPSIHLSGTGHGIWLIFPCIFFVLTMQVQRYWKICVILTRLSKRVSTGSDGTWWVQLVFGSASRSSVQLVMHGTPRRETSRRHLEKILSSNGAPSLLKEETDFPLLYLKWVLLVMTYGLWRGGLSLHLYIYFPIWMSREIPLNFIKQQEQEPVSCIYKTTWRGSPARRLTKQSSLSVLATMEKWFWILHGDDPFTIVPFLH